MRIIGGTYKGRQIHPPANLHARPTTDFAKEGLFNVLDNHIDLEGKRVLELFSGSGSIGLEFVSRGVQSVTGLEWDAVNAAFIRKTLQLLKITNYQVLKADVFKFLASGGMAYDIVFADPPYANERLAELPSLILDGGYLADGGLFILEHGRTHHFDTHPRFVAERHWGNVHFSLFR